MAALYYICSSLSRIILSGFQISCSVYSSHMDEVIFNRYPYFFRWESVYPFQILHCLSLSRHLLRATRHACLSACNTLFSLSQSFFASLNTDFQNLRCLTSASVSDSRRAASFTSDSFGRAFFLHSPPSAELPSRSSPGVS